MFKSNNTTRATGNHAAATRAGANLKPFSTTLLAFALASSSMAAQAYKLGTALEVGGGLIAGTVLINVFRQNAE